MMNVGRGMKQDKLAKEHRVQAEVGNYGILVAARMRKVVRFSIFAHHGKKPLGLRARLAVQEIKGFRSISDR